MATFSYTIPLPIRCSTTGNKQDPKKQNLNKIKITGTPTRSVKVDTLSQTAGVAKTSVASVENGHISKEQIRQNIPTKKQFVDYHRQGLIVEGGVGYRQTVVIRSYEVGADKTATLESILNLLQVIKSSTLHTFIHPMHKMSDAFEPR
jgi:fatty acyl-ACP thioesterase B